MGKVHGSLIVRSKSEVKLRRVRLCCIFVVRVEDYCIGIHADYVGERSPLVYARVKNRPLEMRFKRGVAKMDEIVTGTLADHECMFAFIYSLFSALVPSMFFDYVV